MRNSLHWILLAWACGVAAVYACTAYHTKLAELLSRI